MASSPPGVRRFVSVLNFFAEHPGQAFTFTDIVRALKLGRATCHALLTGLVEAGYLYRNQDKTYVFGPTLVDLANIVIKQCSPLQAVQPELRKLADDFGAMASAFNREGGDVVLLAKAGTGASFAWANAPVGERLPQHVSLAASFFAWSEPAELEEWLAVYGNSPSKEQLEALYSSIEFGRERGYIVMTRNPKMPVDMDPRSIFWAGSGVDTPAIPMAELDVAKEYQVSSVLAPVFDRQGQLAFVLTLSGIADPYSGQAVQDMGQALIEAADRVTYFISGKKPRLGEFRSEQAAD